MSVKPPGVPRVIAFAFDSYRADPVTKGRSAECRTCGQTVKEKAGTTSNFLRHLRKHHLSLYEVYQEAKQSGMSSHVAKLIPPNAVMRPASSKVTPKTPLPRKRAAPSKSVTPASSKIPVQSKRKETDLIEAAVDLIVEDSLSIGVVETPGFNNFMKKVNPKFQELDYATVHTAIIRRSAKVWADVWRLLSVAQSVNATVDVWTDGERRFFIAVTAHIVEEQQDSLKLTSLLLSCQRIVGRNGGEEIAPTFARIVEDFAIERKLDYVIFADAAKIKQALMVSFLPPHSSDPYMEFTLDRGDYIDDESLWMPLDERCDMALSTEVQNHARHATLKCFAHTLHLCVDEVLQKTEYIQYAVLKVCRLVTWTRTDSSLGELLKNGGTDVSRLVANTRRWSDTMHNIQTVISCDFDKLFQACPAHIALDVEEYELLQELVFMMHPFLAAAHLTRNGVNQTISVVVPTVLALYKHLLNYRLKAKLLHAMATDLADSLYRHFKGVFASVGMTGTDETATVSDFGESIYVLAAVLDPMFGLQWLRDVHADEAAKGILRKRVIDDILIESESRICFEESPSPFPDSKMDGPRCKAIKLFTRYKNNQARSNVQLLEYLEMVSDGSDGRTCFEFWSKYKAKFDLLYPLARRVLSIPASSTTIEHVFAEGGIVTGRRQAALDDHTLSHLLFLKAHGAQKY